MPVVHASAQLGKERYNTGTIMRFYNTIKQSPQSPITPKTSRNVSQFIFGGKGSPCQEPHERSHLFLILHRFYAQVIYSETWDMVVLREQYLPRAPHEGKNKFCSVTVAHPLWRISASFLQSISLSLNYCDLFSPHCM